MSYYVEIKELQRTKFAPGGGERRSERIRITEIYRFVPDDDDVPTDSKSLVDKSATKRKREEEEEEGQVKRFRSQESPSVEEPSKIKIILMSFVRGIIDILLSLLDRPSQFVFVIILVRSLSLLLINRNISFLDHSDNYSVRVHQQADLLSERVREETSRHHFYLKILINPNITTNRFRKTALSYADK